MKKSDFIDIVATKSGLSKKDTELIINKTLETITETLKNRDSVSFLGFGSFSAVKKGAREIVLPGASKTVKVPSKYSVRFKTGKYLKAAIQ